MKRNNLPLFFLTTFFCFGCIFAMAQRQSIGGYNVYYGHLHNHTGVSDGKGTPDQAYLYARDNAHLDFFSLSEHSEMMDNTEWTTVKNAANNYNQDCVFTTFYGFEWSSVSYGHVSVINTEDRCDLTSPTSNFSGLLTWVNARNGIAFFNHPGWAWWALQEFNKFTNTPSDKFVGMELWNDVDGFSKYFYNDGFYSNDGGKNYYEEALARGWKIGAAGSDDNHVETWGTRTDWRVGVLADNLTRGDILNAFVARRFFSTLDKNLSLSLKVNGAEMGSTTTGGSNVTLVIEANDGNGEIFSEVQLIKNGSVLYTWAPFIANPLISQNITCSNGDYFYVKVKQQADGDEAISSPVYIQGTANQAPVVSITSPANNATVNSGTAVTIAASASDVDGTIIKVGFFQDGVQLGEDTSSPYTCTWTPSTIGINNLTAIATDNTRASTVSSTVSVNVIEPPQTSTVEKQIDLGSDDAEQYSKGTVTLSHNVLNIVYESKTTGNQTIGLRFTGLNVPKGATITKAYIEFIAASASSGSGVFTIYGEAADDPLTFSIASKNISLRKKTVANSAWTAGTWTANLTYQTTDIKTIVQEIVNRTGWVSGNSMAFIITGTGTRAAKSVEGDSAPKLHIEYNVASVFIAEKPVEKSGVGIIKDAGLLLYPNPVGDILSIRLDEATEMENILIYSITGSLVRNISVHQKLIEKQVDCNGLISGTYLMKIKTFNKDYSVKFIKQ